MKAVWLLPLLFLALSGCFGDDDLSEKEMASRVEAARLRLEAGIGPGGEVSGATLNVPLDLDGVPVTPRLELALGPDGDMLATASLGLPLRSEHLDLWIYCSPDRIIVVTEGLDSLDEDMEDLSFEARNLNGSCTESDDADFGSIGAALSPDGLELASVRQTDKKTLEGTYTGPDGDVTFVVEGKKVVLITAEVEAGDLRVEPHYGARAPLTVPDAEGRMPTPVEWSGKAFSDRYELAIDDGRGALDDYTVRVYQRGAGVPCEGGPAPVASFPMGGAASQSSGGFEWTFVDDGDGRLSAGDRAFIQVPVGQSWDHKVEVWDDWADASAGSVCSIPAPAPVWLGLGLIALVAVARR